MLRQNASSLTSGGSNSGWMIGLGVVAAAGSAVGLLVLRRSYQRELAKKDKKIAQLEAQLRAELEAARKIISNAPIEIQKLSEKAKTNIKEAEKAFKAADVTADSARSKIEDAQKALFDANIAFNNLENVLALVQSAIDQDKGQKNPKAVAENIKSILPLAHHHSMSVEIHLRACSTNLDEATASQAAEDAFRN